MEEILQLLDKLNIDPEEKKSWQEFLPEMTEDELQEFKSILSGQVSQRTKLNLLQKAELVQLLQEWHKQ
ncbi:MAG: hypothetical protein M1324_04175 [Patescibacteria group bacterium]|nr:hypothetical protein [Patescibacteria group bacterium]